MPRCWPEDGGADRICVRHLYKIYGADSRAAAAKLASGQATAEDLAAAGNVVGLNDVSLTVKEGSITVIMGLSGSGKSTLARCINRLITPEAGEILIDGEDIVQASEERLRTLRRHNLSMVFQHFALLPNRTVAQNTEFGLKLRGEPPAVRQKKAREILELVGLGRWGSRYPHELSGGMRQRVGLARALATDAGILIMDEAFSALDPLIRRDMQEELLRLQEELRRTIVFISHDFQEAIRLGSQIVMMSQGRVVQAGSPLEIVTKPVDDYVAAFSNDIDRSRLFDARSVMTPATPVPIEAFEARRTSAHADIMIVVDEAGQLRAIARGRGDETAGGGAAPGLSHDFMCVSGRTKVAELAALLTHTQVLVVLDDRNQACGYVQPADLLRSIAIDGSKAREEEGRN